MLLKIVRLLELEGLKIIIRHFEKFPLKTKKRADFELFKSAVNKLLLKKHLKAKGYQEIVNIRASMNLGLSDNLKKSFPKSVAVSRPSVKDEKITNAK